MKNLILVITTLFLLLLAGLVTLISVKTKAHLMNYDVSHNRYTEENKILKNSNMKQINAVFIGNSITEQWAEFHPNFFTKNNYIGRGIAGQTTPQLLIRFSSDVVDLNPKVVVIGGGINDIAENTGRYSSEFTLHNIKSMTEIAQANGIKVILTSVLPAKNIPWNLELKNIPEKITALNSLIKSYAYANGYEYIDYYAVLVDNDQGLKPEYSADGLHITPKAYLAIEPLAQSTIERVIGNE